MTSGDSKTSFNLLSFPSPTFFTLCVLFPCCRSTLGFRFVRRQEWLTFMPMLAMSLDIPLFAPSSKSISEIREGSAGLNWALSVSTLWIRHRATFVFRILPCKQCHRVTYLTSCWIPARNVLGHRIICAGCEVDLGAKHKFNPIVYRAGPTCICISIECRNMNIMRVSAICVTLFGPDTQRNVHRQMCKVSVVFARTFLFWMQHNVNNSLPNEWWSSNVKQVLYSKQWVVPYHRIP